MEPKDSLPFLEKFHRSALKVETLSKTMHTASKALGVVSGVCFAYALGSLFLGALTPSAGSFASPQKMRLQAGMMEDIGKQLDNAHLVDETTGQMDFKAITGLLSTISWAIFMAKAKAGTVAAVSKQHSTVKQQLVNVVMMAAFAGVIGFV